MIYARDKLSSKAYKFSRNICSCHFSSKAAQLFLIPPLNLLAEGFL